MNPNTVQYDGNEPVQKDTEAINLASDGSLISRAADRNSSFISHGLVTPDTLAQLGIVAETPLDNMLLRKLISGSTVSSSTIFSMKLLERMLLDAGRTPEQVEARRAPIREFISAQDCLDLKQLFTKTSSFMNLATELPKLRYQLIGRHYPLAQDGELFEHQKPHPENAEVLLLVGAVIVKAVEIRECSRWLHREKSD